MVEVTFAMIELPYSLVIEATDDPTFFGFFSPELEGFSGIGHSIEDCVYQARWGMREYVELLEEQQLPVPAASLDPFITVRNQPSASRA
jgi:predicted RNase H-like HicB family nuclease